MIARGLTRERLRSGPPWHLECLVERVGDDYLCRIHGGDRHIGAVALSQWSPRGATVECLTVAGHKERGIAVYAAKTLCTASRRSVTCIAGIHFDSMTRTQVEEVVRTAHDLTRQVARQLEQRRTDDALG